MKNPKINYVEYEMESGEFVTMSTAPVLLLKMKGKHKEGYKRLSRFLVKGVNEEDAIEIYELLYNTYLCANQEEGDVMTFAEFVENANQSYTYNAQKMNEILNPEKKQHSEQHSEMQ